MRFRLSDGGVEESDAWLDSVDAAKDGMIHKPAEHTASAEPKPLSKVECLYNIYRLLGKRDETVLQAVQRYGRKEKGGSGSEKDKISKLESLSSFASDVIGEIPTIYEESKVAIRERIKPELEAKMAEVKWVYKLSMDDDKLHGPYTSVQMQQWRDAGYFVGPNAAYLRRHHSTPASSSSASSSNPSQDKADLAADLMDDSESEDEQPAPPSSTWQSSDQVDFEAVTFSSK